MSGKPGRSSLETQSEFLQTLSFLVDAGIPLSDVMRTGAEDDGDARDGVREAFARAEAMVGKGARFADVVQDALPGLSASNVAILKAGEETGNVARALDAVKTMTELAMEGKERLVSALAYPAAVSLFAMAGGIAMATWTLSGGIGAGSGSAASSVMGSLAFCGILLAVLVAAGTWFALALKGDGEGSRRANAILNSLPVVGEARKSGELHKYCFVAKMICDARLPFLKAAKAGEESVQDPWLREALAEARTAIERGSPASRAFAGVPGIPPRVPRWIGLAERTGSPEKAFAYLERYYGRIADGSRKRAFALLEPFAIVFAGIFVAAILLGTVNSLLAATVGAIPGF